MKKFFTAATAAALTASMVCAPAAFVVSAAETAAFEVCIADQFLQEGTKSINVPVSLSKDTTFKTMDIEFSCTSTFVNSSAKCAITKIVSSLPADSGVKVAVSGNKVTLIAPENGYTVRKGTEFLNLAFEVTELIGDDQEWPVNAPARIKVKSFSMTDRSGTAIELDDLSLLRSAGNVQVVPANKTTGLEVSVESVISTESQIKVPLKLKGSAYSFITEIKVSDGAKIVDFEAQDNFKSVEVGTEKGYLKLIWHNQNKFTDVVFKDEIVGYIVLDLKETSDELSKSSLTFSLVDVATANLESTFPSVVKNGMAVKGVKGDLTFDGSVDARDSSYNIQHYNESRAGNETYIKELYENDEQFKDLVDAFGSDKLAEIALKLADVNDDGENDTRDASLQLSYYNALRAADDPSTVTWESVINS